VWHSRKRKKRAKKKKRKKEKNSFEVMESALSSHIPLLVGIHAACGQGVDVNPTQPSPLFYCSPMGHIEQRTDR